MKNREKFAKEILDIACNGSSIAMDFDGNLVPCSGLNCNECCFNSNSCEDCDMGIQKWCESEYVEKLTLTTKEKKFLDLLLPNYKYIAREKNGFLLAYTEKPIKILETWGLANCALINMFDIKFDFIKREDEEPWSIEDLKNLEVRDDGKG